LGVPDLQEIPQLRALEGEARVLLDAGLVRPRNDRFPGVGGRFFVHGTSPSPADRFGRWRAQSDSKRRVKKALVSSGICPKFHNLRYDRQSPASARLNPKPIEDGGGARLESLLDLHLRASTRVSSLAALIMRRGRASRCRPRDDAAHRAAHLT